MANETSCSYTYLLTVQHQHMMTVLEWIFIKKGFLHTFYKILNGFMHYVCAIVYGFRGRKVPPAKDRILLTSATTLAKLIREKQLTSESVVQAYIDRILEVDPFINAVVDRRFEEAMKEAKEADTLIASGIFSAQYLEKEKPLFGVPFSVKIMIKVKGLRCTAGSLVFKNAVADEDAMIVSLMKKAGAIVLATTNCSEIGLHIHSSNNIHGTTSNPYDTSKTSGGSSGGEGALISAAGSVIGLGNDMGGSIRIPCMFNGIFGHKPTRELVSNEGTFPPTCGKLNRYVCCGPMCRYAEDLVTMMKILATPNGNKSRFGEPVNFKNIKVYYMYSFGENIPLVENVQPDIINAMKKVVSHFETQKNSQVKEISLPHLRRTVPIFSHAILSSVPNLGDVLTAGTEKVDGLQELLKYICFQSKFTMGYIFSLISHSLPLVYNPKKVEFYRKMENEIDDKLHKILDENSILILPTLPFPAPYHNEIVMQISSACYSWIFNVLGMPSSQCPIGFSKQGLPVGVQIVSRRGNDHLTIAAALEIEKAFGGWKNPK